MWGAGGSGRRDTQYTGAVNGGGGGGYGLSAFDISNLPASVSVTVGAGGLGRDTSGVTASGGDSEFGTSGDAYYILAKGGYSINAVTGNVAQLFEEPTTPTTVGSVDSVNAGATGGVGHQTNTAARAGGTATGYGGDGGDGVWNESVSAGDGQTPGGGGGGKLGPGAGRSGNGGGGRVRITIIEV